MKLIPTTVKAALGVGWIAAAALVTAAVVCAAPPRIEGFGTSQQLVDGPMVTSYTVSELQPSNVVIAGFTPAGQLYQAEVTAKSDGGTVTPVVSNFNARAAEGQTYRMVNAVPVPNGLNPAPIAEGDQTTGTLYFDVTGPVPNGVIYNDGTQDVLIWTSSV